VTLCRVGDEVVLGSIHHHHAAQLFWRFASSSLERPMSAPHIAFTESSLRLRVKLSRLG
jgi:hypothetical protein